MTIPKISTEWTDNERLSAIQYLARLRMNKVLSGKYFSEKDHFDLLDRIDNIANMNAYFLEVNRSGLFRDLDQWAT